MSPTPPSSQNDTHFKGQSRAARFRGNDPANGQPRNNFYKVFDLFWAGGLMVPDVNVAGKRCLEIGSGMGSFLLAYVADWGATSAIGIEPNPVAYAESTAMIAQAGNASAVQVLNNAVWSSATTLSFSDGGMGTKQHANVRYPSDPLPEAFTIEANTLDQLVPTPPDAVMCNTHGSEFHIWNAVPSEYLAEIQNLEIIVLPDYIGWLSNITTKEDFGLQFRAFRTHLEVTHDVRVQWTARMVGTGYQWYSMTGSVIASKR